MGGTGFAMPLLSTLAALVIIVHSAEENYEREYRVMRPRAGHADISSLDQPWKTAEIEPSMTQYSQITQGDTWDEMGSGQNMRRSKPVRKRKRRPQLPAEDETVPQERYDYNEEPQTHHQENIERPKRRRKKIDHSSNENQQNGFNEEIVSRRKRRRGQKRKRPLADAWPTMELDEFADTRRQERTDNTEEATKNNHRIDSNNEEKYKKTFNDKIDTKVQIYDLNEPEMDTTTQIMTYYDNHQHSIQSDEDKSLSELSIESKRPKKKPNITLIGIKEKIRDKTEILTNNIEHPKEKEPLDPLTLKALLKRSNGKSLSEILQQNNLSLSELLHGRERALSILKNESARRIQDHGQAKSINGVYYNLTSFSENVETSSINGLSNPENIEEEIEHQYINSTTTETNLQVDSNENVKNDIQKELGKSDLHVNHDVYENHRRGYMRRRFPGGIRRKLRTRPTTNHTYKAQLSRDLIALTSLKYKNNRNTSRSREWKEIMPSMIKTEPSNVESNIETEAEIEIITTTPCSFTETSMQDTDDTTTDTSYTSFSTEPITKANDQQFTDYNEPYTEKENIDAVEFTTTPIITYATKETVPDTINNFSVTEPAMKATDLREQAFNNRLKRKRHKHKSSTTEIPEELEVKDSFGIGKFITTSDLITNTQPETVAEMQNDFTTLENYMTTESLHKVSNHYRSQKPLKTTNNTFRIQKTLIPTEKTAKFEIEEIFNDNHTSEKLSKILKERNMTLSELVEHRERGSSHVHLADIFHNASKEPNPPEPFLSKSLLEPISKETYPLRALLEANLHDPRTATVDPNLPEVNNVNIPVVMNFGNNVNENGENMGILSLFNNYSQTNRNKSIVDNVSVNKSYDTADDTANLNRGTTREGRTINNKESETWNDLINYMQKNQKQHVDVDKPVINETPKLETTNRINVDDDIDEDGMIVLDDLELLKDFENKPSSDELLEFHLYDRNNPPQTPNKSSTVAIQTRSVTVATASIIGLALTLFLLTYALLKWKQQNKIYENKHAQADEFVPTPVFEGRKGQRINSSTRSKSPMLASNIYSIDTIETHVGSESPEYMWDTIRKPYQ